MWPSRNKKPDVHQTDRMFLSLSTGLWMPHRAICRNFARTFYSNVTMARKPYRSAGMRKWLTIACSILRKQIGRMICNIYVLHLLGFPYMQKTAAIVLDRWWYFHGSLHILWAFMPRTHNAFLLKEPLLRLGIRITLTSVYLGSL